MQLQRYTIQRFITTMSILDIILLLLFIPAFIQGITKGFVIQVFEIIAVIIGVWVAYRFSGIAFIWFSHFFSSSYGLLRLIVFILIMIVCILLLNLLGQAISKIIKLIMLGWLDKILGIIFALIKTALILGLLIILFNTLNIQFNIIKSDILVESVVYTTLKNFAYTIFPYLKELLFK